MLPESEAPPLAHLDEFKTFVREHGARALRIYEPAWEDPETGETCESYWQVYVEKSELRSDGKMHAYYMTISDEEIARDWREGWRAAITLLDMGWQAYLEKNGLV